MEKLIFIFRFYHCFQADCTTVKVTGEVESNVMSTNNTNWWQNAVFYQIYPRSFKDGNNDGIGDLKGITSKLAYLADTGIDAIWLSPIFASPMIDFGYDISDFTKIHNEYGTIRDFEDLMARAKELDIKVLLDFVPNHTSDQCEWFKKSAARTPGYEDFYIWSDGKVGASGQPEPPNNWSSVFYGSAWQWNKQRGQFYLHQFTVQQPDLNFRNPRVVEAMDEILHFWLDKGVAGFRIDAVNHLFESIDLKDEPLTGKTNDPHSYDYTRHIYTKDLPECVDMLQHWRNLLDTYTSKRGGPQRIMMTEAYADIKQLMEYYEDDDGRKGSHIPFNFCLITDLKQDSDARDFVYTIQKWLTYMPHGHVANWVMGNHDNPRVASRFGVERVDVMNMLLMLLPGVAVTYNGEEIGMEDYRDISWENTVDPLARNMGEKSYKDVSRDPARTPFQWNHEVNAGFSFMGATWLPVHPNYKNLNLEKQKSAPKSHYKVYKALLALRKLPVLQNGHFALEAINKRVLIIKRALQLHRPILAILNMGNKTEELDLTNFLDGGGQKLEIIITDSNSKYKEGQHIPFNALKLSPHGGLVCML